jgi:transposase
MTQSELAERVGCDESTVYRWIKRFREDGVILYRDWHDDNRTHHAEYKVIESVVEDHKRRKGAERPPRYQQKRKANKGSFTTVNQPGVSANRRAVMEEDDE